MKRGLTLLLTAALMLFTHSSCNDKEQLCNTIEKADLACNIGLSTASIILGQSMNVINKVTNLIAGGASALADCTRTAEPSDSDVNVLFRENENEDWKVIENFALLIESLIAGGLDERDIALILNQPGQYVFETFADVEDDVDERNENNNHHEIGGRGAYGNNYARSEILTVLPNPKYNPGPNKPQVEIISITRVQ